SGVVSAPCSSCGIYCPNSFHFVIHSSRPPLVLPSFPTRRSSDLQLQFCQISILRHVDTENELLKIILIYNRNTILSIVNKYYLRSEEHTSELQSRFDLVCRLLLEKKKTTARWGCARR